MEIGANLLEAIECGLFVLFCLGLAYLLGRKR